MGRGVGTACRALVFGTAVCVALGTLSGVAGATDQGSLAVTTTPSDVRAVHVSLLHTGEVLLVAGSGNDRNSFTAGSFKTSIWNPTTGALRPVATPWDAFCAGHAFLPDGSLLVAGGTSAYPGSSTNGSSAGTNRAYVFDPDTERYRAVPNMGLARWYPSVTELGDGSQFVLGGLDEAGHYTSKYEVFDPESETWSAPTAGPGAYTWQPMYPAVHLLRDGRLFYSGVNTFGGNATDVPPGIFDLESRAYRSVPGLTADRSRDQGASVMVPPAQDHRVMVIGGGDQFRDVGATATTAIADLDAPNPSFTPGPALDAAKMYVSAVVLPDSTVLQTGGATKTVVHNGTGVHSTQIYDPAANTWRPVASPTVDRLYHSSAILLPDGRVATFGSNPTNSFEMRIEVYTPPYLQTGTARPVMTGGPSELHYGESARWITSQAAPIRSAVLVRPGSTTHSSDPNQRLVDLAFTKTATGVSVTMPTEPNLAPPGWYMLNVVDANGVPSVSRWVHLDGQAPAPDGGYVLDGYGGLHPFSIAGGPAAPKVTRTAYWPGWDIARGVVRRDDGRTGYVLDAYGGVHRFAAGSTALPPKVRGTAYWSGWDITRGIALLPDGSGGYVLDGYGGIHRFATGSNPLPPKVHGNPYWAGIDAARGITVLPDGSGGYVVDAFGRIHPFRIGSGATPPKVSPSYQPGPAPVRGVAMAPDGAAGYVLDGWGGLHAFPVAGGAPRRVSVSGYWPGWAIARNVGT
jgi:hypothetical protein